MVQMLRDKGVERRRVGHFGSGSSSSRSSRSSLGYFGITRSHLGEDKVVGLSTKVDFTGVEFDNKSSNATNF